ncbi:MAG: hypothetical protein Q9227_004869 [Pyrenula ochraceoflavens]
MGKGGRIACIFTPFILTLASLICLVLVWLGGTNKSSSTLANLYFFKADLTNFTASPNLDLIPGTDIDNEALNAVFKGLKADLNVKNYYEVFLQNYCDSDKALTSDKDSNAFCSPKEKEFWFDPVDVWQLNKTDVGKDVQSLFPKELRDGLKVYKEVAKWMWIAYVCALVTTIAEFVVGFFAIFSRWGSFFTTIVAVFASTFTIAASITSTALFSTLTGAFNTALKAYGIHGSLGHNMFVTTWLAVAFSLAASFFWLLSVCCCSGRSPYHRDAYNDREAWNMGGLGRGRKRVKVEKTPYTYERVESPYMGARDAPTHQSAEMSGGAGGYSGQPPHHQNIPMINLPQGHEHDNGQGAYEPYRRHDADWRPGA